MTDKFLCFRKSKNKSIAKCVNLSEKKGKRKAREYNFSLI